MKQNMDAETLLKYLSQKRFVIYGTGFVGRRFLSALKQHGLYENIACFTISECVTGQDDMIEGIPVRGVSELDERTKDMLFCIAVHESLAKEIEKNLEKLQVKKYIWIYPFLYELSLGQPLKTNVLVNVDKILESNLNNYGLAVRYLAVEQFFGKNQIGYDLYVRFNTLYCTKETAERRLIKFCDLIKNWKENGYDKEKKILINSNYEILDGCHRITVAKYFGEKNVICDVFSNEISVVSLLGDKALLTEKGLKESDFCKGEQEILRAINRMLKGEEDASNQEYRG